MFTSTLLAIALTGLTSVSAAPIPSPLFGIDLDGPDNKQATTALSEDQLQAIAPIALFSQAAYCSPPVLLKWQCGDACLAHPNVQPIIAGGDDAAIPGYFVAFDPDTNSVIVSHQGTQPEKLRSDLNDIKFIPVKLDTNFFSGADSEIKVHDGFQETWARTANDVLAAVQKGLSEKKADNVLVTGHSLGAAIAIMDSVFLKSKLPADVPIKTTVFGLPRGGNQEWADFVDKTLGNTLQHVVNDKDIVPTVPPRFIGFRHPSGEIFIKDDGSAVACPGQENENCTNSNGLFEKSILDHLGPYAGVKISPFDCPL